MTTRFSLHRSLPRGMAVGLMALSMALWGCAGEEISGLTGGGPLGKKGTPTPSATGVTGSVQTGPTASPTVAPTPTPTPSPTGSPSPTPTPEPLPTPFAMGIRIAIATNSINLAPVGGGTPLYPYTTKVSGTVTMSNALTSTDIDWKSSNPAIATVTSDGTVTAGSNTGGTIQITGTSKDGQVSDSLNLNVTTFGGAEVVVD